MAAQIVCYEVTGTGGAFACSILIKKLGNNYAFLATPACYFAAGVVWWFVDSEFSEKNATQHTAESDQIELEGEHGLSCGGYITGWVTFGAGNALHPADQSTKVLYTALKTLEELCGTVLGLSFPLASSFGWSLHIHLHYLATGTSLSYRYLVFTLIHQLSYLENNLANIFATAVLKDSSFQQIMVGGSNFGELCGATTVFFTVNHIPT